MENFQKIAVLIDADNTQLSKLEAVLHEVSTYGRIVVKKAYGNWRKDSLKNWEPELKRLAIRAEQQFDYVTGKNTTDIAMVIGAMDPSARVGPVYHRRRRDDDAGVIQKRVRRLHPHRLPVQGRRKARRRRARRGARSQEARPQDEKDHPQHEKAGGRIYPGRRRHAGADDIQARLAQTDGQRR